MAVSLVRPNKDGGNACEAKQRWRYRLWGQTKMAVSLVRSKMAVSLVRPNKDGGIACEVKQRWRYRL